MGFLNKLKKVFRSLKSKLHGDNENDFKNSRDYWENRYLRKSNSGSGSYGRLAVYKAKILNNFVYEKSIKSVTEFGCGDGNQLKLANYPNYTGYDISKKAISICQNMFVNDKTKQFKYYDSKTFSIDEIDTAELVLSLDVIYHLIEDDVFEDHMSALFMTSNKYVIIYSSNYNDHFVSHVKCREFTKWINENVISEWEEIEIINNEYPFSPKDPNNTSMSDFYIFKKII